MWYPVVDEFAIAFEIGHRQGEYTRMLDLGSATSTSGTIGSPSTCSPMPWPSTATPATAMASRACWILWAGPGRLASGDPRRAAALLEQAVSIADATGDVEPSVEARSWLARVQMQLSDPAAALAVAAARRELRYLAGEPTMRLLEGLALLELHRVDEAARALSGALTAADAPLALADRNVVALQAQAPALSGLAAAVGDPGRAREAAEALTRLRTTTSAAGMDAATSRLLDVIASHGRTGNLAGARADGEW